MGGIRIWVLVTDLLIYLITRQIFKFCCDYVLTNKMFRNRFTCRRIQMTVESDTQRDFITNKNMSISNNS